MGGSAENPPAIEKLAKPRCPVKLDPPIRRDKLGGKFLGFFGDFSGKFREISGNFGI